MATKKKKPTLEKKSKKSPKLEIKEEPKQEDSKKENKILKAFLITLGIIILISLVMYIWAQESKTDSYKNIKFNAVNYGSFERPLIMYETETLSISNDGNEEPFGFRMRTKPSKLKKISFENSDNLDLMKINGYTYSGNTFQCEGDGIIAMENLRRLFQKMGMDFIYDEEETCDPQGRYNYFYLVYGNKTEIREIGKRCYEVVIKGDDSSCEIIPATEKLMVELYSKYLELNA